MSWSYTRVLPGAQPRTVGPFDTEAQARRAAVQSAADNGYTRDRQGMSAELQGGRTAVVSEVSYTVQRAQP